MHFSVTNVLRAYGPTYGNIFSYWKQFLKQNPDPIDTNSVLR